jgi:hypothetical protein
VSLFGLDPGGAPIDTYTRTVNEASPALIDLIRVATFKYGLEFVLFGLGFAFVGLALLLLVRDAYVPDTYAAMFTGVLVVFSVGGAVFLLRNLIVGPDRPFQIGKIVAVVLAGELFYLLWYAIDRSPHRTGLHRAFRGSLTIGLLLLVTLSVFSFYPSPLGSSANSQVTEMEVDGTQWLMEHGSAADELIEFQISYERFYHARNGVEQSEPFEGRPPPDHFNYTEHEYAGASYAENRYLTINRYGRVVYPQGFSDYRANWRFTPADYDRLERDRTVARVYDNGDYNLYLIDGTRTAGTRAVGHTE